MVNIFLYIIASIMLTLGLFSPVDARMTRRSSKALPKLQEPVKPVELPQKTQIYTMDDDDDDDDLDDFDTKPDTSIQKSLASQSQTQNSPDDETGNEGEPEEEASVLLNFENAELSNVINYITSKKDINIVPTKETAGARISLSMRKPMTPDEAWNLFFTIIESAGFTVVKAGPIYKVVRQDVKKTEPLPAYINVATKDLPDSDLTIRFVTILQNIATSDVEQLMRGMLGAGGDLIVQPNLNGFIITDKCYNIKAAMKVINELDQAGIQEVFKVLPLKRSEARDVKALLDQLIKQPEGNPIARALLLGRQGESSVEYFSSSTKIIVEERSNSLILLGTNMAIKKIEDFIDQYIEHNEKMVESPIHYYPLQNADAAQIKGILEEVVNASSESGADQYGGVRNGGKYFRKMRFEVDQPNNALVISSVDKQDWKILKKTLQDLDKHQPQVAIETLIVNVAITDNKSIGAQLRLPNMKSPFDKLQWQTAMVGAAATGGTQSQPNLLGDLGSFLRTISAGNTVLSLTNSTGMWGFLQALKTQTNTSIIDNPFITIANRVSGTVSVGETKQVAQADFQGYGNSSYQGYIPKKADTKLTFKPQINLDGIINLGITINIDSFETGSDTSNKMLQTSVAIANGQVLILGGFVKTQADESEQATPVLSRIPVLGWLFKQKTRNLVKTYTFLFISPTIVKPREKPGSELYTKMKLSKARDEIKNSVQTDWGKDPIHNWFFNSEKEDYHHKVPDFANARYQPTNVDIKHDPYYTNKSFSQVLSEEANEINNFSSLMTPEQDKDDEESRVVFASTAREKILKAGASSAQRSEESLSIKSTETEQQVPLNQITQSPEISPEGSEVMESAAISAPRARRSKFKKVLVQEPQELTYQPENQRAAFKKTLSVPKKPSRKKTAMTQLLGSEYQPTQPRKQAFKQSLQKSVPGEFISTQPLRNSSTSRNNLASRDTFKNSLTENSPQNYHQPVREQFKQSLSPQPESVVAQSPVNKDNDNIPDFLKSLARRRKG